MYKLFLIANYSLSGDFMKKFLKVFLICLFAIAFIPLNNIYSSYAFNTNANDKLYLGGFTAGFSVHTRGAYVMGICDVVDKDGNIKSPSKEAGICVGDVILSIDGIEVNNALDIEKILKDTSTKIVVLERQGESVVGNLTPIKDVAGKIKMGVFIRDGINGIGTVTYIKGDRFASLGHPILSEEGTILPIINGDIYKCNISGVHKGERGTAGELRGVFIKNNSIGSVDKNLICGVYGCCNDINFDYDNLIEVETGVAQIGDAKIYCTIEGNKPCFYDISIVKTDFGTKQDKNLVVKVTDDNLLKITGGIVQGMSGSPIVQNGKLVGAITHVFLNDPTRGFGIMIENMINN